MHKRRRIVLVLAVLLGISLGWYSNNVAWAARVNTMAKENQSLQESVHYHKNEQEWLTKEVYKLVAKQSEDENAILSLMPTEFVYQGKTFKLRELVTSASKEFNIPVGILVGLGLTESTWDCSMIGTDQDTGCLQVIPSTGEWAMRSMGISGSDLFDPAVNVRVGAWVLRAFTNEEKGDWAKGLASYNAGPGAWDRAPIVSRGYAARVLSRTVITPKIGK